MPKYDSEVLAWRNDPVGYWLEEARAIDWVTPPETAFSLRSDGMAAWFPDGRLNICANALDRHVAAGHGNRTALIWESPVAGQSQRFTYAALTERVARLAGGLRMLGVTEGDRVLICMPPVPEAVVAMLAVARLGAVHVFTFAGFAAPELATRIDDTTPRVVITASCGYTGSRAMSLLPAMAEALGSASHRPSACVLFQRNGGGTVPLPLPVVDFAALETAAAVAPVSVLSTAPLYILHTSGTTGQPKGVVRDTGGHAVALRRSMRQVYAVEPAEVFCCTADLGWVVGHSYAVYAPLLTGCTTVLFEGGATGTPDAGSLWRLCADHGVVVLFTSPSALRAMRAEDPAGAHAAKCDLSALRAVFVAGERADAVTLGWASRTAGVPARDHWWQTETGSAIAGTQLGLGNQPTEGIGCAVPGFDLQVVDELGHPLPPGNEGELVLKLPLPPGCLTALWGAEDRLRGAYLKHFPGHYRTFDLGVMDASGSVMVLSRTDDVLKVAGRRIAAGRIEEVLAGHPEVAECAVVGRPDVRRGEVPVGYIVRRPGVVSPDLRAELVAAVRAQIGGLAGFRHVVFLDALPRTRSGKIIRRLLALAPPQQGCRQLLTT
jgi:propionyl-CoA synthetase